jgi:hypothetical protein
MLFARKVVEQGVSCTGFVVCTHVTCPCFAYASFWFLCTCVVCLTIDDILHADHLQVHPCINEAYLTDRLVSRMPMLTAQVQFLMPCMQSSLVPLR